MFHIVLVEPEIPHNTGAAGRLALATDSTLHLVGKLGFSLDESQVRRTGLDYWRHVKRRTWPDLEALIRQSDPAATFWYLSTKAEQTVWQASFEPGDYLVFGKETQGLPDELIRRNLPHALRIPMAPGGTRSLNLSTAIAITLYRAVERANPAW